MRPSQLATIRANRDKASNLAFSNPMNKYREVYNKGLRLLGNELLSYFEWELLRYTLYAT